MKKNKMNFLLLVAALSICTLYEKCHAQIFPEPRQDVLSPSNSNAFPKGRHEHAKFIDWSYKNFSRLETSVFFNHGLVNLIRADLPHNNITSIGEFAFVGMSKLKSLDLHENLLTTFDPNSFAGLVSLKHLNLASNQIHEIHAVVLEKLPALKVLDLSNNRLSHLEKGLLRGTPKIYKLILEGNNLVFHGHGPMLSSSSLTEINLRLCSIRSLPSGAFQELPGLIQIELSGNELQAFPMALLEHQTDLEILVLDKNPVCEAGNPDLPAEVRELACDGNRSELEANWPKLLLELRDQTHGNSIINGHGPAVGNRSDTKHHLGNRDKNNDKRTTVQGSIDRKHVNTSDNFNGEVGKNSQADVQRSHRSDRTIPPATKKGSILMPILIGLLVTAVVLIVALVVVYVRCVKRRTCYDQVVLNP